MNRIKQLNIEIMQQNSFNVFFLNVKEKCQKHDRCVELRNPLLTFSFSRILNTLMGPG